MNSCACFVLVVSLAAALAEPSLATHVTIRPDGSGDFPTIDAAVQAMMQTHLADTIQVEPGAYDEVVNCGAYFPWVIHGRAGPDSTRVRAFVSLPELPYYVGYGSGTASGLRIVERVAWGRNSLALNWRDCVFEGGYFGVNDIGRSAPTRRCVFRDSSAFIGFGYEMEDCRFERAPVYIQNVLGYFLLRRCTFTGPGRLLARVTPRDESNIVFDGCRFSDAEQGIVISPLRYSQQFVDVNSCRFERIGGTSVYYKYGDPAAPEDGSLSIAIRNSVFSDVGSVLHSMTSIRGSLGIVEDTVRAVRGNGIEATVRTGIIQGLVMRDVGGTGVRLYNQTDSVERHGYPENWFTIADSRISRCGDDGIEIQQLPCPEREPQELVIRDTDVEACGGSGIRFLGGHPIVTGCLLRDNLGDGLLAFTDEAARPCSLARNTAAGNRGRGIAVDSSLPQLSIVARNNLVTHNALGGIAVQQRYSGLVAHNDAWANDGPPYFGVYPFENNLELDPLYCGRQAGDFSLHTHSPCGPEGPFGPIGARGVGCTAPLAVESNASAPATLRVAPQPAREFVSFAWGPGDGPTRLEIFDTQGRRQWSAPEGSLIEGSLRWDASGSSGRRLSPGVYLVRWVSGAKSGVQRLVLLER